jgi:C_GCAxxG_C_C family probable redox protein
MLAVGEHLLGNVDANAVRMTTGFAGGVGGSRQELCGALSAGVMIIGALHGRSSSEEDRDPARRLTARLRERFAAALGTTHCDTLYAQVYAPGGLGSCSLVVERAAGIMLELLHCGDGDGTDE